MHAVMTMLAVITLCIPALSLPDRSADGCGFVLGFATLHDLSPSVVGDCVDDEGHNPDIGDALQHTTGGLLVWRKADNFTAFTDGVSSWVNGPDGVQRRTNSQRFSWEANPEGLPLVEVSTVPQATVVAQGLVTPWALAFLPDGRMLVTERPGRVRVIIGGQLQAAPWLTLPAIEQAGGETGLMGLAVDPNFARNHFVYAYYTYRAGGLVNRLVRLRDDQGTGVVDSVLLDGIPGAIYHDGGRLRFGPDGKLYLTVGDALTPASAQNLGSLNGKVLRMNADGSVPDDNPYPGSLVYASGFRNPEGLAWHPLTGQLYVSVHGPSNGPPDCCHDAISLVMPGSNYGWPAVFGMNGDARYRQPILESGLQTWAPGGIAFGLQGPWKNALLVTELRGQQLRVVHLAAPGYGVVTGQDVWFDQSLGRLRDVVTGPDGALYLLTSNRDGRGTPQAGDDKVLRVTLGS